VKEAWLTDTREYPGDIKRKQPNVITLSNKQFFPDARGFRIMNPSQITNLTYTPSLQASEIA